MGIHLKLKTQNPKPYIVIPTKVRIHLKLKTQNPKPYIVIPTKVGIHLKLKTQNPKPKTFMKIRSPRHHREIPQRYRLEGARTKSGEIFFPPRRVYPGGESAKPYRLSDTGKVLSFTIQHTTAREYSDLTPLPIGIIELSDGARLTAQIVDVDPVKVKIGMKVKLEFRKIRTEGDEGLLCYGYKAVPA